MPDNFSDSWKINTKRPRKSLDFDNVNVYIVISQRENSMNEYFADYDTKTHTWCVFHTDRKPGFAFASYADQKGALEDATQRNRNESYFSKHLTLTD